MTANSDVSDNYKRVVELILRGDSIQARESLHEIPSLFPPVSGAVRTSIPRTVQLKVFKRDSYSCQFCGKLTIFVPVLRLLSIQFPADFPFHTNWKMENCHIGYWRDSASCDHLIPVARGGTSDLANLVTACYMCNSIKQNWLIEELRWEIQAPQDSSWDGLTSHYPLLLKAVGDTSDYHRAWRAAVASSK